MFPASDAVPQEQTDASGATRIPSVLKRAGSAPADPTLCLHDELLPGVLAASLQVFVDGVLAAHEVSHFGPHLFDGGLLPQVLVFKLGNHEAARQ